MLGYAGAQRDHDPGVRRDAVTIELACEERGWELTELLCDVLPPTGTAQRPALSSALDRVARGEAARLVVARAEHLARSAAELAAVLDGFAARNATLVVLDLELDTSTAAGHRIARALTVAGGWDRRPHAPGRRAVSDDPELRDRIATMRAQGMTLQAIADALNAEGIPTPRGGMRWRRRACAAPSSTTRPTPTSDLEDPTMPDRHDMPTHPCSEHARRAYAVARLRAHRRRELDCLTRAVSAGDDLVALRLEASADEAYLDALAVAREHEVDADEEDD